MAEKKQANENKEKQQQLQQKYLEMQLIDQQLKQVHKQLLALEQQINDAKEVLENLDSFSKTKVGSSMLVPVSSGIFVKATLADNKELAVNVGANTIVKKTVPETKELLDKQIMEMQKLRNEMSKQSEQLSQQGIKAEEELRKLAGE